MNYFEFQKKFPNEIDVINYFIKIRYKEGAKCPYCGNTTSVYHRKSAGREKNFVCKLCNNDFSIFKGTIFEKSDTDLRKWFYAINLVIISRKGISAKQLEREVGVTYKTAWRMLKQIRTAMGNKDMSKAFEAFVEIDETYVGGKPRKGGKKKKDDDDDEPKNPRGRGTRKTPVIGVREKTTKRVYAQVALPDKNGKKLTGKQLFKVLDKVCKDNALVVTDDFKGYNMLDHKNVNNFVRLSVNHSIGEYSLGYNIHTNGVESFWALLKRGIFGIYHHVSVKYLQNYINEFTFRMNDNSFNGLVGQCVLC